MQQFSDEDFFYKGFIYAMRLSHEGLMPVLDETVPIKELMRSIQRLDRARDGITELMGELSCKVKQVMEGEVSHVEL